MSEEMRPEQELSEILQIRRDKLKSLQDEGRDPFQQTKFSRTHWTSEVTGGYEELEGKTVSVAGRIMSISRTTGASCNCTSAPTP